eukprot:TRINITY_DN63380_c0_g1_i1.p1 TRINITY_DN63380_c0_g1~~TRINITY_DN63380_c0_g1_i1.p1  ORF type:complete len:799 (-),score=186.14 TRINITY_DN63380_c0_g1_i1:93-2489(-)
MIFTHGKKTQARNETATLAFQQYLAAKEAGADGQGGQPIKMEVENEGRKFWLKLFVTLWAGKDLTVFGPVRGSREEAILDGRELVRAYKAEGEIGAKRLASRLERKAWSSKEKEGADESLLQGHVMPIVGQSSAAPERLIPPGEGWTRHDDEMLVNLQSQVLFSQEGMRAGKYFKPNASSGELEEVEAPHIPQHAPVTLRASSASWIKKGGTKLDRAVLLPDITKICRLALKFPLSFVDTPASAFALFQGLRNAEAAQWCAENFHKKLLPLLAAKIHTYEAAELEGVLRQTIEALDAELIRSSHAFSGVSAVLALSLGQRLTLAGVGQVRVVLLPEKGAPKLLLGCRGSPKDKSECARLQEAGCVVKDNLVYHSLPELDEANRILSCRHAFDVLQVEAGGPSDEKQVRSAYRKLALRVHPDKQAESEADLHKAAFARLESAKEELEAMLAEDSVACRALHRLLRGEVYTRAGAALFLSMEAAATASMDSERWVKDAQKAATELMKGVATMQKVAPETYLKAQAMCEEAVECLRRSCTPESLPRQEALLKEPLASSRAMGARDLRKPFPIVVMEPETASHTFTGGRHRLSLLCGPTAMLDDGKLAKATAKFARQPKASALRWCLEASGVDITGKEVQDATPSSSSVVCVAVEMGDKAGASLSAAPPAAKKARTAASSATASSDATVRIRHMLFRHGQLRQLDPNARRDGAAQTAVEAEMAALAALEKLQQASSQFPALCRQLSDCQSAAQPGQLSGDLGWLSRGQQEQSFEEACFALKANELSDVVTTSRGVHVIQRLA